MQQLQKEADEARREAHKDILKFRSTHQRPELSREWDLNNPARFKEDIPARVSDTDPRCGVSSLLKFTGEDLEANERKKSQMVQQKKWLNKQLDEKKGNTMD